MFTSPTDPVGDRSRCGTESVVTVAPMVLDVIAGIEQRRRECGEQLDPTRRSEFGQFFTPVEIATFMAELLEVRPDPVRLLDPGAGVGSLTAAVTAAWAAHDGGAIDATTVEADPMLVPELEATLRELSRMHAFEGHVVGADFVEWAVDRVSGFGAIGAPKFDIVAMNPPYRKIHSASPERRRLSSAGIEAPNLYAGFVALAAQLLDDGGQLVAITPRSFTNGPYFRRFRRMLLDTVGLRRIHVFDARDLAFADSEVLQENVIFAGTRGLRPSSLVVSSSRSVSHAVSTRTVPYEEVVRPDDPEAFLHITLDDEAAEYARRMTALPCRLAELELQVSTGPVVDFRSKEHLRAAPESGTVPLLYPSHLRSGRVTWPQPNGRKPNAIVNCADTARLFMPAGVYVLVKRFSAKEEARRIVATLVRPEDLPGDDFAFENHLNVFHRGGHGLPLNFACGLVTFLNTTTVDQYFRQFNGHTQVNATDLRSLRYPSHEQLVAMGSSGGANDDITADSLADALVPAFRVVDEVRSA